MPLSALAAALIIAPYASPTSDADAAFQQGHFIAAKRLYATVLQSRPKDFVARSQMGYLCLLSNQFKDAEHHLKAALAIKPGDPNTRLLLAETYYRQDRFVEAAPLLKNLGKAGEAIRQTTYPSLNYAKLASFKGLRPYDLHATRPSTTIKLLTLEPLPLLHVRVNGGEELTFFIDTGGAEVTLDYGLAKRIGVPILGTEIGTFAGGKKMQAYHGRIKSLQIGDWDIRNLPIQSLDLKPVAKALGRRIDGIIGTMLFYHYLTTLDYPKSELVLNRQTPASRARVLALRPRDMSLPIWLAGDHFAVTPGSLNGRPPVQMFVDTGYVGGMFKAAPSTIKSAGLVLDTAHASQGQGAGGGYTTTPFKIDRLNVGPIQVTNRLGTFEGVFPWEHTYGFLLAGMIGHDFFNPYSVTFDFQSMTLRLRKG